MRRRKAWPSGDWLQGRLVRYWFGSGPPDPNDPDHFSEDVGLVVAVEKHRELHVEDDPYGGQDRLVVWWPGQDGMSRHPMVELLPLEEEA